MEVDSLRKVFPRGRRSQLVAVDGVSFSVGPGEVFGLLGPNDPESLSETGPRCASNR